MFHSAVNIIKIFLSLLLFLLLTAFWVFLFAHFFREKFTPQKEISRAPYKIVYWPDFGSVFAPEIKANLQTLQGQSAKEFLLDSGALVSSFPPEASLEIGAELADLPRIRFKGFGNTHSFAYKSSAKITIGRQELILPIVFTQSQGTRYLLGRQGFFDQFTIIFDHKKQEIIISQ